MVKRAEDSTKKLVLTVTTSAPSHPLIIPAFQRKPLAILRASSA